MFEADLHLASLRDLCATEVGFRNTFSKGWTRFQLRLPFSLKSSLDSIDDPVNRANEILSKCGWNVKGDCKNNSAGSWFILSRCSVEPNMNWHSCHCAVAVGSGTRPRYLIPLTFVKAIKTNSNLTENLLTLKEKGIRSLFYSTSYFWVTTHTGFAGFLQWGLADWRFLS